MTRVILLMICLFLHLLVSMGFAVCVSAAAKVLEISPDGSAANTWVFCFAFFALGAIVLCQLFELWTLLK